jgi:hypothetical protein
MDPVEVGQKIRVNPTLHPIPARATGRTFVVAEVMGHGDDQFATLTDEQGRPVKRRGVTEWFRSTELTPAPSASAPPELNKEIPMSADTQLNQLVETRAKAKGLSLSDAAREVFREHPDLVEAYRAEAAGEDPAPVAPTAVAPTTTPLNLTDAVSIVQTLGSKYPHLLDKAAASLADDAAPPVALDLSVKATETFSATCLRVAREAEISLKEATRRVSLANPAVATRWSSAVG